jgi:hypothetical protein
MFTYTITEGADGWHIHIAGGRYGVQVIVIYSDFEDAFGAAVEEAEALGGI